MRLRDLVVESASRQEPRVRDLVTCGRPVWLYGAGVYAYVLHKYLLAQGVEVAGALVDREFLTSDRFCDLPVRVLEDELDRMQQAEVVIATANYPVARERLRKYDIVAPWVIDVPDFLNIPDRFMTYRFFEEKYGLLEEAFNTFADQLSRATFVAALNAKIAEDVSSLLAVTRPDHLYFPNREFSPGHDETLLDIGGFNGDSIRDFHRITAGQYRRIISLEPYEPSFRALEEAARSLGGARIRPVMVGAWDSRTRLAFRTEQLNIDNRCSEDGDGLIQVDTIDSILEEIGEAPTLLKLDINGAESRALAGAKGLLHRCRPNLVTKIHVKEDFYRIPLFLKEIAPDMKLYLRQRNFMSMMLVLHGRFEV